jgi:hypothetical protein
VFGAILGPAALALLQVGPPGRCWSCAAPTQGWLTRCLWCDEDVREPAPDGPAREAEGQRQEVRVRGPLTVIDGSARRAPIRAGSDAQTGAGRVATDRGTTPRAVSVAPAAGWRASEPVPGDRRMEAPVRSSFAEAAGRAPVEPAADPVHRLKARLGGSGQMLATAPIALPRPMPPTPETRDVILASAIYVTGSRGLQAGSRYGIAIHGGELRILGPVDIDPAAVAMVHSLRGIDATGLQGRLIITAVEGRRDHLALVFMSLAGGSTEAIADAIVAAANEPRSVSR